DYYCSSYTFRNTYIF
nr:immunoglobulin light chain junction region [Macaca mulatta]